MSSKQTRVLILCTHNSARSQMAEGLLRHLSAGRISVESAGSEPGRVHPLAIQVMDEIGIDITDHRSKSLAEFLDEKFDYVITVCDQANETCPFFPGSPERIHWSFPDPSSASGDEQERLKTFRDVRDAINARLREWTPTSSGG